MKPLYAKFLVFNFSLCTLHFSLFFLLRFSDFLEPGKAFLFR